MRVANYKETTIQIEKVLFLLLALILLALVSGCASQQSHNNFHAGPSNKFFYYPSSIDHGTPTEVSVKELWLSSNSGNRLHGQYWHHKNQTSKGLIVHFHGNAGNLTDTREKVDWLYAAGWELLIFDYSGYGQSQGRPTPLTLRADGVAALEQAQEIVTQRRLSAAPKTPFTRLENDSNPSKEYSFIVIGTSLGGAVATDALAHWLKLTTASVTQPNMLVVDSSFNSYTDTAAHVVNKKPLGFLLSWLAPNLVSDITAPHLSASQLKEIPKLYVHCQKDQLIPESFGQQIFASASAPKSYWSLPQCGHARSFTRAHPANQMALSQLLENPQWLGTELAILPLTPEQRPLTQTAGRSEAPLRVQ